MEGFLFLVLFLFLTSSPLIMIQPDPSPGADADRLVPKNPGSRHRDFWTTWLLDDPGSSPHLSRLPPEVQFGFPLGAYDLHTMSWHQTLQNPIPNFQLNIQEKERTKKRKCSPATASPSTWGDIKALANDAQEMLKKQDKEPTPENLFIAMCAKLTANSMNTCDQDLIPAKTKKC